VRRELAKTCEISYEAVRQWFSGDTANIRNEHLVSIARKYKVSVDWLLSGDPAELKNSPDAAAKSVGEQAAAYQGVSKALDAAAMLEGVTPRSQAVIDRIAALEAQGKLSDADLKIIEQIIERFSAAK
jgi:transcriptional regulator with XRE-family HTH domain